MVYFSRWARHPPRDSVRPNPAGTVEHRQERRQHHDRHHRHPEHADAGQPADALHAEHRRQQERRPADQRAGGAAQDGPQRDAEGALGRSVETVVVDDVDTERDAQADQDRQHHQVHEREIEPLRPDEGQAAERPDQAHQQRQHAEERELQAPRLDPEHAQDHQPADDREDDRLPLNDLDDAHEDLRPPGGLDGLAVDPQRFDLVDEAGQLAEVPEPVLGHDVTDIADRLSLPVAPQEDRLQVLRKPVHRDRLGVHEVRPLRQGELDVGVRIPFGEMLQRHPKWLHSLQRRQLLRERRRVGERRLIARDRVELTEVLFEVVVDPAPALLGVGQDHGLIHVFAVVRQDHPVDLQRLLVLHRQLLARVGEADATGQDAEANCRQHRRHHHPGAARPAGLRRANHDRRPAASGRPIRPTTRRASLQAHVTDAPPGRTSRTAPGRACTWRRKSRRSRWSR